MMKKIVLMLGIVICFANKTYAETWNCGPETNGVYSDSVQCTYDEENKTLTISGDGPMGDYAQTTSDGSTAPWYGKDIVHAVIEGNVTTIGDRVFKNAYNLQDITGTENITSVGRIAFYDAASLISIDLPNVQEIGVVAFLGTSSLEYVGIPDGVTYEADAHSRDTFRGSKSSNCRKTGECGSCEEKFVQAGAGCVDKCYKDYMPCSGYCCLRTRYTLSEADEATSNDNENTIEWIFE